MPLKSPSVPAHNEPAKMIWESPLKGYENSEPLPDTLNSDRKSLVNLPGPKSAAYDECPKPIDSSNNPFDFHIYYMPNVEKELKFARELHERIRREFPEVRMSNGLAPR